MLNQENKDRFANVLRNVSEEEKDIFDYNKNQPYQTDVLRKQALLDASSRNTDNALSGLQDTASNVGNAIWYKNSLNSELPEETNNNFATASNRRRRR
jgi:hypothetical protein